ncbi:MAG: hypothetical protein ACXADB_04910 [Candidatus Hermodarchaeia archaeon]|jgi:uncharacterized membrane protein
MRTIVNLFHLFGITFWVGGLFVNTLVLMPSLGVLNPAERGKLLGVYLKRFALLTWGAVALAGVTGLLATNSTIGFSGLFSLDTRFGNVLLAKIVVTLLMILNGIYLGFVLGPKMSSFGPPSAPPTQAPSGDTERPPGPPPELLKLQSRMTLMSWIQVVLAAGVLLLVAMW